MRVIDLSEEFRPSQGHDDGVFAHARGDLVFLLDSDLEEEPGWLGMFNDVRVHTSADVVFVG